MSVNQNAQVFKKMGYAKFMLVAHKDLIVKEYLWAISLM